MAARAPGDAVFITRRDAALWNLSFRPDVFGKATAANGLEGLTPSRPVAYGGFTCGQRLRLRQRESSPADAWHGLARMTLDVYSGLVNDNLNGVAERLDAGARVYSMCAHAPVIPLNAEGAGR